MGCIFESTGGIEMNEETEQQSAQPVESTETQANDTTSQTLEDIAKKYSIEDQAKSFTAKPENSFQSPPLPEQRIPDPVVQPDEWSKYHLNQSAYVNQNLQKMAGTVDEMRRAMETERLNAEVNKAVARVNDKLKIDPKYAEILLEKEYRDNRIFQRIWDNRYVNPKALDEALDVIANSSANVFQTRSDPQLVENQRAAKASQRAMSTTNKQPNDEIANMTDSEFDRWWHTQKGY
jgi:hypothetical protein